MLCQERRGGGDMMEERRRQRGRGEGIEGETGRRGERGVGR